MTLRDLSFDLSLDHHPALPDVDVLMATYFPKDYSEGINYLKLQLASILKQDYAGRINIIIRDDGSCSDVLDYLSQAVRTYPNITLIQDNDGNLGHTKNFERLLENSTADYCLFSDQDDIWDETKISKMIKKIQEIEDENISQLPILVHHDAQLMNASGEVKHHSLNAAYFGTLEETDPLLLLGRWSAPGFTMIFNRFLKEDALPFPQNNIGHDNHVVNIAAFKGIKYFFNEALANYRVHTRNTSNPNIPDEASLLDRIKNCSLNLRSIVNIFEKIRKFKKIFVTARADMAVRFNYSAEMIAIHSNKLSPQQRAIFQLYVDMGSADFLGRAKIICNSGLWQKSKRISLVSMAAPRA